MRNFPTEQYELDEIQALNAKPWQVDLLKLNPSYTSWGPYEDYMSTKDGGWNSAQFFKSWKEFGPWGLDELNEVVNFYFEIERPAHDCPDCGGVGYNKDTMKLYRGWYGGLYGIASWRDKLTEHEVKALWDAHRLNFHFTSLPTPEEVNKEYKKGLGHDSINCHICVRARAEKLGVYGKCPTCAGRGHIFETENAQVNLVLWFLHPRKGCSRGVEIKNITQEDVPEIINYLKEAALRNTARFNALI